MSRIIPPLLFALCALGMALLSWLWPIDVLLPRPYNLLGALPLVAGLTVGFLGVGTFLRRKTSLHTFGEPGRLVTDGIFKYTRNPMYLGFSLMLTGIWLLLGSLSPVVGLLAFVLIADRWYIRYEERQLMKKFAADYQQYRRKTRRWI